MTARLLGAAWAGLVLLVAAERRSPPRRVRALAAGLTSRPRLRPPPGRPRAEHRRRRYVLAAAGAALVALLVGPAVVAAGAGAVWAVPRARASAAERRRVAHLEAAVPEVVDLVVLAVGAGCNVSLAVAAAGRRGSGPLAAALRKVSTEEARGRRLADALDELPAAVGEPARGLASVLAGCERYGTPALPALQRLADDVRLQRQRRAEAAARRVPVTLLFPLVVCILPAFALLTVAPLIAGALRELRL